MPSGILAESPGVVGVFASKSYTVATTNSWNFLQVPDLDDTTDVELQRATQVRQDIDQLPSFASLSNVIIGVFDTGTVILRYLMVMNS